MSGYICGRILTKTSNIMKRTILSAFLLVIAALIVQAQNITVQGTVLSKTDDEPLIGASVLCNATKAGAVTDIDGNFKITVPEGAKLKVSYVGYNTTEVKATPEMKIYLAEDSELLDEVVVVGYSSEKKADLTGSVSVVKMKDVSDTPTGNVVQALQGRVAGMNVTTDGTPGGLSTGTSIRGASSFRGDANGPLYVIDGVMTRENPGTILNSNDVESIQVLKDAASASIYGAQAANGVIIITTKKSKERGMPRYIRRHADPADLSERPQDDERGPMGRDLLVGIQICLWHDTHFRTLRQRHHA